MSTLVGSQVIFPKGGETFVLMSLSAPGPKACPTGDSIAPFLAFPSPKPGTLRKYRLKAVYYDGYMNSSTAGNIQIIFTPGSGASATTFNLPTVQSSDNASNFHYSDWQIPSDVSTNGHFTALYYNVNEQTNAVVFSLELEAHDFYQPGTAPTYYYYVTITNQSTLTLITHRGDYIGPAATWTSEELGNGYVSNPLLGTLSFYDLGTTHLDGDGSETYGVLISLRGYDYVGRYNADGQLSVTINAQLQAKLSGMDIVPVALNALTH